MCHFIFGQVILGNTDVKLLDFTFWSVLPGRQAHVLFLMISPINNHFGSRLAVNRPVQLVLDGGEKALGGLRRYIVVDGRGVNIGDLLVKLALGEANFPNALQLLLKVLFCQDRAAAFDALIIHHIGLDGVLMNDGGRPFAELHCTF